MADSMDVDPPVAEPSKVKKDIKGSKDGKPRFEVKKASSSQQLHRVLH